MSLSVRRVARFKSRKRGQKFKKKNWSHTRPTPVGPYARPEVRQRLALKSLKCFGSRWKWYKLAGLTGLTIAGIEKQMDAILTAQEIQYNEWKKQRENIVNTTDERSGTRSDTGNGRNSPGVREKTSPNDERQEVRSGETKNESATDKGDQ